MNFILQPSFFLPISADTRGFYIFIHNQGQMYTPKLDGGFGSFFFHIRIPDPTRRYGQTYRLERTHMKLLKTKNQVCDDENTKPNTTLCITTYFEKAVGCSIGMRGGEPNIER